MFNQCHLQAVLLQYKKDFLEKHWQNEKYKWEAVKCFQDNFDIEAQDVEKMLTASLLKTASLLDSINNFPKKMIIGFAKTAPEEVRSMYLDLFDEKKEVYERINTFKKQADILLQKYGNGAGQHYQAENAITTYLYLRYPDKYYVYRYSEVKAVSEKLASSYIFRKGEYIDNLRNFYAFYDELCEALKRDSELVQLLQNQLRDDCYPDPELKTLTFDVGSYIAREYLKHDEEEKVALKKEEEDVYTGGLNKKEQVVNLSKKVLGDENTLNNTKNLLQYTQEDFLSEVYMDEERYTRLSGVLLEKMNVILQGAPGVGKTFAAKRLAYSLMGEKDDSRIEFVQFHQNYSYEDFMMGYRPVGASFELKYGIFYRFCKQAEKTPEKKHFFIIDEINRGNLSKIFGELLLLIEKNYRGVKTTLAYNGMPFTVPPNLYVIGMMNTADRSLAMIDYALRRRFSFFEMQPAFTSEGFLAYQKILADDTFDELIKKVIQLNEEIARDKSLGKGFCIGHSYFVGKTKETCTDMWMQSVVDYDILPMLAEYWFDDDEKVERWEHILHGVFT